jgi:imidazolonepropionase-like amidohydrolase
MRYSLFFLLLFLQLNTLKAQVPTPAPKQTQSILIWGATAHLGNGQVVQNSAIAFENGILTMVADATLIRIDRSKYATVFEASGKHVYPGFIAANSSLGLIEISAVRSTVDNREVGQLVPNNRTIIAYNTDSDVTPTLRSNGVLMAQVIPSGGFLSGSSSVVQLDAWNYEDAIYRADDGVHLQWPQLRSWGGWGEGNPQQKKNEQYDKDVQTLHQFFGEAKAYCQAATNGEKNLRFEAMRAVFEKKANLYVHTDAAKTIQESILFAEKYGCKPVLVGGNDAWKMTDFLVSHQLPVILNETQRLPERDDDALDQPFKTPAILQKAGVLFSITGLEAWQQRNLPFQAGQAVGYGLDKEAALAAITLNTAKILGIDKSTGSLEVGKDATLFISEGDALDMRTNKVTAAFIQGRSIDLDNKQKQLAKRFGEKYKN